MVVQVAVLLVFATLLPVGAVQSASLPSPALASAGSAQERIRNDSASQRSTHPLPLDRQPDTLPLPSLFVRPDTPADRLHALQEAFARTPGALTSARADPVLTARGSLPLTIALVSGSSLGWLGLVFSLLAGRPRPRLVPRLNRTPQRTIRSTEPDKAP